MRMRAVWPAMALLLVSVFGAADAARADVASICAPYGREWDAAVAGGNTATIARIRAKLSGAKGACPDLWRRVQGWKPSTASSIPKPAPSPRSIPNPNRGPAAAKATILIIRPSAQSVFSAAFSADGNRILTYSMDNIARVWDANNGRLLFAITGKAYRAYFSPDGSRIVTASDGPVQVVDARSGRLLATATGYSAAFSTDGRRFVTTDNKIARIWDAGDGHLLSTLTGHTDRLTSAVFSPDSHYVVTASSDNTIRIWAAESGNLLVTLSEPARYIAFAPDGRRFVTNFDKTSRVWDLGTQRQLVTLSGYNPAFSPDGRRIITRSDDKTVRVWDPDTGRLVATLTGADDIHGAAFSPDSRHIVTASGWVARIWDTDTGRLLTSLPGHTGYMYSAVFSPDGRRIVTASADYTVRVWNVAGLAP